MIVPIRLTLRWSERPPVARPHLARLVRFHSATRALSVAVAHLFLVRSMARIFAILLVASLPSCSATSEDRPIVMRIVDAKTGRESGALSDAQVDEIVRFVRTLPGIDLRVLEVDGTSPPQVEVRTGWIRAGRGHGDWLRIEKRDGHWILLSKDDWNLPDGAAILKTY
jgi:hypothetical protein